MFNKLKALPKKIKVALTTAMIMCTTSALAFAEDVGGTNMTMTTTQLKSITDAITNNINVTTIISFLGAIFAIAAIFALMWFGVRKAISVIMGAVRKGRIGG